MFFLLTVTSKAKENKLEENEDYFEKAIHSAKQEINREMIEEKRRERNSNIEEVITLVQYQVCYFYLVTRIYTK